MIRRPRLQPRDWLLIGVLAVVLGVGLAFVHSASYRSGPMGEGYYTASPYKQVQWIALGALLFAAVLFVNYRHLLEHAYLLYGLGIAGLVLVLFVGVTSEAIQVRRWIAVGSFRIQPSEIMKIFVILAMARYLVCQESHRELLGLFGPFALVGLPMALIAKEPDLGMAILLLPIVFAMLYVAAARARHLFLIVLLLLAAVPAAWPFLKSYQKERVLLFLFQDDPHQRYEDYQLRQAQIAIGSGGVFGKGWEKGTQNRLNFIPPKTRNNDFIFAVICEEWGFLGANFVLALYFLLLALCVRTAEDVQDPAGRLIIVGVVAMLGSQVIVNTAMTMGQLPIVGLTLPLISYGGSSLLSTLLGVALVVNVGVYRRISLARDGLDPDAEARREMAPMPEESFMHP